MTASPEKVRIACEAMDRDFAESDALLEQVNPIIARLKTAGRSVPASITQCVDAVKVFNALRAEICGEAIPDQSLTKWGEMGRRMRHANQTCQDIAAGRAGLPRCTGLSTVQC